MRTVDLKKANPNFPILVREAEGVEAKMIARYGMCPPTRRAPLQQKKIHHAHDSSLTMTLCLPFFVVITRSRLLMPCGPGARICAAEYPVLAAKGQEKAVSVAGMSRAQVGSVLEKLVKG